jgi:choline dehydrogenase
MHQDSFDYIVVGAGSAGCLLAKSADPLAAPRIETRYLTEEKDRRVLVAGLRMLREIYRQPAFRDLVDIELGPQPAMRSDRELLAYAREKGGTAYHPVGTCRMGSDNRSVVDPSLRVRRIDRLRVIDASVMPALVSTNTNAATIMIAEKAAALLRGGARRAMPSIAITPSP